MSGNILESISELSFTKRYQCYLSPKSLMGGWVVVWWWDLPIIESISRSRPEKVSENLLIFWSSGIDLDKVWTLSLSVLSLSKKFYGWVGGGGIYQL